MTADRVIDLDELTMDAVRGGALRDRPVTVLGFARSGIALARFLADQGARVTVYDGRPLDELREAIDRLEGRPVDVLAGPDVDPATTWADAARVTTSPSINPDYPTTEPRLRAALGERGRACLSRICSFGCVPRRRSASPARRARRRQLL